MGDRQDELFGGRRRPLSRAEEDPNAAEDDVLLARQQHEQAQEQHLDAIGASLQRVSQAAEGLGDELRMHMGIIDEVSEGMERTGNTMKAVEAKTAELVERSGGPRWFCLTVALSAIAFFLFLLIIYD